MKSKLVAIMLCLCFSLAGCVSKESHEMVCGGGEPLDNIWWGDAHQWNGAPMSYGNTTSQEVWIEIRASGKDTHPDNDYGDYFLVKFNGKTTKPQWCE